MRNIIVCCDGTSNEFGPARTNVSKLVYCLDQRSDRQLVYYHPGVGTMAPPGALTRTARGVTRVLGLMFGYGLPLDVRNIYTFLMNNYREGDRIFLFGFSRGAYFVRAVASLIHTYGLLPQGNDPLVAYAVRYMLDVTNRSKSEREVEAALGVAADFKRTFGSSRYCPVHFVGVWDTVGSVGWFTNPVYLPYTADNASIMHGRQAIAIDERRAFFRTNLWRRNDKLRAHGPRDEKQVWFAGVHSDVGGGYPEPGSGLSKIALEWMMREAEAHGLLVDVDRKQEMLGRSNGSSYAPPCPGRPPHESLNGGWKLLEYVPKPRYVPGQVKPEWRSNRSRRRSIPEGSTIHDSVFRQPQSYLDVIGLPKTYSIES